MARAIRRSRLIDARSSERGAAATHRRLDAAGGDPSVVSLCAGDGRDVLPVLGRHPKGPFCRATFVELSDVLASRIVTSAGHLGLDVDVIVADAGTPAAYAHALPADVVLFCGIFGNVPDDDIRTTIASAGGLVRRGGRVIWTRHRWEPDLTPQIRDWFTDAGFEEVGFDSPGEDAWSVGTCVNRRARITTLPEHLFAFEV